MEDTKQFEAKQFEATFVRWLSLLKAEQDWKEGNRNPLEQLLEAAPQSKEESHVEALQLDLR